MARDERKNRVPIQTVSTGESLASEMPGSSRRHQPVEEQDPMEKGSGGEKRKLLSRSKVQVTKKHRTDPPAPPAVEEKSKATQGKGKEKNEKKKAEEKETDEAARFLQTIEPWYPFGEKTFNIPVHLFRKPPSHIVCQMLSRDHCNRVMRNMLVAPVQDPQTAVVLPFNPRKDTFLCIKKNNLTAEAFWSTIPKLLFFAISGQHSAEAARILCEQAQNGNDPKLKALASRLKTRQCKILDGDTPHNTMILCSKYMNVGNNELFTFKSPFHHKVEHAREQYIAFNRPARPSSVTKGKEKKEVEAQWKVCKRLHQL
jgi:hypothetical protein